MKAASIADRLLGSQDPAIRYKIQTGFLGKNPESQSIRELRKEIKESPRVQALLSERREDGTLPHRTYMKWRGAHWVLTLLADLGYPSGDRSLTPMADQACTWAISRKAPIIEGRPRRCASQEGNALLYMIRLGFDDDRCEALARKLVEFQWPDGGWNCDRRPQACHSSFNESLIPMRALNAYVEVTGNHKAKLAARRAAEMFLERRLFRRKTNGEVIRPRFARTHYPYFWQYTYLHALRAMAEASLIRDPRCSEALDLLESRQLPDGGFPAEQKYYSVLKSPESRHRSGQTLVDWGPTGNTRSNEFVTAEALSVLKAAARIG